MNDAQNEVIDWWYGRRDYRNGIELLSRYCKNKTIINTLSKHGKEKFPAFVKKLHYEITKAVHLDWLHMPDDILPAESAGEKSPADIPPEENQEEEKNNPADTSFPSEEKKKTEDISQYPRVIRLLKYEYSELYNKRSRLHNEMRLVEQANTKGNNEQRSALLTEIKSITNKLVYYYEFIENFENNGIVPDETEVWPPEKVKAQEEPKSLPELKKLMGSLRRENYKDGFRLQYQQRTKAEKENPMPKGSKRDAIELRMKLREIKLAETITLIAQLENAG
jgi:hypothetical protein